MIQLTETLREEIQAVPFNIFRLHRNKSNFSCCNRTRSRRSRGKALQQLHC